MSEINQPTQTPETITSTMYEQPAELVQESRFRELAASTVERLHRGAEMLTNTLTTLIPDRMPRPVSHGAAVLLGAAALGGVAPVVAGAEKSSGSAAAKAQAHKRYVHAQEARLKRCSIQQLVTTGNGFDSIAAHPKPKNGLEADIVQRGSHNDLHNDYIWKLSKGTKFCGMVASYQSSSGKVIERYPKPDQSTSQGGHYLDKRVLGPTAITKVVLYARN